MYKKVMLAYDGSDAAMRAIEEARSLLSGSPDSTLFITTVSSMGSVGGVADMSWIGVSSDFQTVDPNLLVDIRKKELLREKEKLQNKLSAVIENFPCQVKVRVLVQGASIADSLIEYANDKECDLVMMGCRGLGALRGVIGSVSYAMLRSASMPVLIVK